MTRFVPACLLAVCTLFPFAPVAAALELHVGAQPLQRALVRQLFSAPDGRFYLRGTRTSACFLFAHDPQLRFSGNRIELDLGLVGKLGRPLGGQCVGFRWSGTGELSMLPEAQGQRIGFADVRAEHLTGNGELDQLLGPLVSALAPRSIHVDAAALIGKMLRSASERSSTTITLQGLTLSGMQVENSQLELSVEGSVDVQ